MPETAEFDDVTCVTVAKSGKAILVKIDGNEVWIPSSQVHDDSEVWKKGDKGTLILTEWIARQKGLI